MGHDCKLLTFHRLYDSSDTPTGFQAGYIPILEVTTTHLPCRFLAGWRAKWSADFHPYAVDN